ncbi:MAG: serine protease [Acidobacteriota bacterium]
MDTSEHTHMHHSADGEADIFDQLKDELRLVNPREVEFMKLSRRVCLIERDDASEATGILVGPDLMLTTAHALMGTSGIFADPDTVTIRFDRFVWNARTGTLAFGDSCKLRRIPFTDQPDVVASSIKTDPKCRRRHDDNDLDYVLVRLDRPMGLTFLPYSHRIRGWNNCSRANVPAQGSVFVVQHPIGGLQRFAEGYIPAKHDDREFPHLFRYKTTALNGSSGSPIVDEQRRVVGMHVGERSESEQLGISFQKIFEDLQNEKVKLPPFRLTKEVMDSIFGTSGIERKRKRGKDWRGDRLFDDIYDDDDDA